MTVTAKGFWQRADVPQPFPTGTSPGTAAPGELHRAGQGREPRRERCVSTSRPPK